MTAQEFPTIDDWMRRRADERARRRARVAKLRVIQGGKQETQKPKSEAPTVRPLRAFVDPLSSGQRAELVQAATAWVSTVRDKNREAVAGSLVASVEWALAAKVPWSDFIVMARNEYIKAQARHKPGPVKKI